MVRNLLSGCDGGSSLPIKILNKILVRQSIEFIPANSFKVIEKEVAQEQAADAKRAWVEDGGAVHLRHEAEAVLDDPMKNQEKVVRCRLELKALHHAAVNVQDVSKKLDIVVSFLFNINGQLSEINEKLDMIQQDIASIRNDLH